MAVLDIQRRSQQIGRIRIGQKVKAANGGMRPDKLSTFRFTTASRRTAEAVAELFGGQVRDWESQYEVITDRSEIGVTVPPRDAVISQWYEMWTAGGCQRRCDSQREQISGGPCKCPHADDPSDVQAVDDAARKRAEMAKYNPPQACKLVTRINVMIPDLPGLGVFRLDTGSFYAAGESGDKADLMELARERNLFLPATLRIEQRKRVAGGKTTSYPVPVLEILSTFRAIANGDLEAGGMAAQLPPAPAGQRRAIAAPAASPAPAEPPAPPPGAPSMTAQQIADVLPMASTRRDVEVLAAQAEREGCKDDSVCVDRENDVWEQLHSLLAVRWKSLPAGGEEQ